jgi:hypothetical protein
MNLAVFSAASADDWDVFYQKYSGRFFVITWDQQNFKKMGLSMLLSIESLAIL